MTAGPPAWLTGEHMEASDFSDKQSLAPCICELNSQTRQRTATEERRKDSGWR